MDMQITNKKRTLKQLVLISVGLLFVAMIALSAIFSFSASKHYVQEQLAKHSQEAATFLGIGLSSINEQDSGVGRERLIDAMFDSGDYQSIVLRINASDEVVERMLDVEQTKAPLWFVGMIDLQVQSGDAEVMSGWQRLGSLKVVSNSALAIDKLWERFVVQLILFAGLLIVGILLLYSLLRYLLAPLVQLEQQAQRIANRFFEQPLELPPTRELDSVARSINDMAQSLKKVFDEQIDDIERLRDLSRLDDLTGLFNREGFDARLKSDLVGRSVTGVGELVLVMLNDFESINLSHGRQTGDELLQEISKLLKELSAEYRGAYCSRRSGAQFSVFLSGVSVDCAETYAQKLLSKIQSIPVLRQGLKDDWVNVGVAEVSDAETVSGLLSKADMALRQAQSKGISGWQRYVDLEEDGVSQEVRQANHWQSILQDVLQNNALVLHEQPVQSLVDDSISHKQLLSRIELDGEMIVASTFLPMAKRFGLMVRFDEMIVEAVFAALNKSDSDQSMHYNIALSEAAIADTIFMEWLIEHLRQNQSILHRVTFEVPEHALGFGEEILLKLCELGDSWGFGLCIDRFGVSSIPFTYLKRVRVRSIKIDTSFIRDIHENQENQFFLRSVVQIAHSQNIQVVAIGVESAAELAVLKDLGVDAATGYQICKPSQAQF